MNQIRLLILLAVCLAFFAGQSDSQSHPPALTGPHAELLQKRWLFVWRNLNDPAEVDRMLERFPRAAKDGYNGVVFSGKIAAAKAPDIRRAAESNHLALI